ncbi:MAG: hypothetical protein GQ558_05670 [Thermoplasmata archaeon]|nr:hypothetical protein [Thermoplasmata archaeon]
MGPDEGTVYIGGNTNSSILPVTPGCFDPLYRSHTSVSAGFVAGFNMSNRSLVYCTYIGGANGDELIGMVGGEGGRLYLGGGTLSDEFPVTDDAVQTDLKGMKDSFAAVLDPRPSTKLPMHPSNIMAEGLKDLVFLRWDPPPFQESRLIEYRIYRGLTPDETVAVTKVPWYQTYFDDANIPAGRYYYRISSINTLGEGPVSDWVVATPWSLPGPPQNLTGSTGNGTVALTWDPPITLDEADLEYRILRGIDRDDLAVIEYNCENTFYFDDDVEIGKFYYYAVTAVNQHGIGVVSEPTRATAFGTPSQPMSFDIIPGDGRVVIRWGIPNDDGGTTILGYRIFRGTTPENIELLATLTSLFLTITDTNVTNGQAYIYYMVAFSAAGDGDATKRLDAIPFGLPSQPLDLVADPDDGSVHLSWAAPSSDGGNAIFKYLVLWGDTAGDLSNNLILGNVTSYDHTDLSNGVTYYYQLVAVNNAGEGQVSIVAHATPMGSPSGVVDMEAILDPEGIRLTWKSPVDLGGAASSSLIVLRDTQGDPQTPLAEIGNVIEYLDTTVEVGKTYYYRILVVTDFSQGPFDEPVEVVYLGPPGQVTELTIVIGNDIVDLSWVAPDDDGGSPILNYVILRGLFETGLSEVGRVGGSVLMFTDQTTENGKTYFYGVYAINTIGAGSRSESVTASPVGPPGAPGVLEAKVKDDTIALIWTAPTIGGKAEVTGYKVYRGRYVDELSLLAELGDVQSYIDEDVEKGKTYFYKVMATSDSGDGDMSRSADAKIQTEEEESPALGGAFALLAMVVGVAATMMRRKNKL